MGFMVTIAAVPLAQKEAFLNAAGVQMTDQPDADGQDLISAVDYGDYFLIWRNLRAAPTFSEPDWPVLSNASPITVLDVVDTAGAQVLRGYEGGALRWEVSFQDSNDDLFEVTGRPPFDVDALRTKLRAEHLARHPEDAEEEEAGLIAGYGMEIPSRLFEELTGLYYEDGPTEGLFSLSGDLPQIKLTWTGKPKDTSKPWWKIW